MRARHGPNFLFGFRTVSQLAMGATGDTLCEIGKKHHQVGRRVAGLEDSARADVLETIHRCGWSAAGRKGLAARAGAAELGLRRRPATAAGACAVEGGGAINVMEESLLAVGRLAGCPPEQRVQISEAKAFLRSAYGLAGGIMASRLSRLSKDRNALAHLDVGLPVEQHREAAADEGLVVGDHDANGHSWSPYGSRAVTR